MSGAGSGVKGARSRPENRGAATQAHRWSSGGAATALVAHGLATFLALVLAREEGCGLQWASDLANTRCVAKRRSKPAFAPRRHCDPVGVGATSYFMSANANLENTGDTPARILCDL